MNACKRSYRFLHQTQNNASKWSQRFRSRNFHTTSLILNESRKVLGDFMTDEYGIDPKFHHGVFKALESVYGKELTREHLQTFGESGLQALAASVKLQKNRPKRPSVALKVTVPHHKTSFELKWKLGDSIRDVADANDELMAEYLEGTCGGNLSCCTCHVYIEQPEFQALLEKPEDAELDMLDLAYEPKETSRLGCAVRLTKEMINCPSQLEIVIPRGVNNVWK